MFTYWSLGRKFDVGHERAIRYIDDAAVNKALSTIPVESTIKSFYCDKCNAFHIVRPEVLNTKI